ncbi:lexA repressor [bacterium BMS3Bbin11]|nr:lexA repressor [bacterium BMS3Abin11]GBE46506.1 lexA repressor [bacterium BMS3Bbin11]GMT41283.1 MAG: LexA repressor 1 [bacterium]HDH16769.1 transcriptional repressor LexA [Gammaproteobacteria bacterium]HDZ78197.1 transcriptional repressor LexA [Gammaproteobacteria bacterium]
MLTDRQRQTLNFIRSFIDENGYPPKLKEIGDHLGITSRGTVHRYIRALEDENLIQVTTGRSRGIVMVDNEATTRIDEDSLPLAGTIAAGMPIEAIEDQETINLNEFFVRPGRFVLRVQGDSMIEDGIFDGDMVIMESCQTARDNEIVVALIDREEATLKRIKNNQDGSISLIPANQSMQVFRYSADRVSIQGRIVGQFRAY